MALRAGRQKYTEHGRNGETEILPLRRTKSFSTRAARSKSKKVVGRKV